jgi:Fe-S-cluster-containing hydrogenase component 2
MPSCGGCGTCEMACSFKHKGEFVPAISSIKILERENEPGFRIFLVEESDAMSIACDGCKELDVPLCMQYCKESERLEEILKEFMEKMQGRKKIKKAGHRAGLKSR